MNDEVKNPFPGLRPFEFEDNHLFFGRDEQTTELTTRLRKNRFVAVVGTSGSGKSSLVRAGLLPELLSGTMAGAGSSWETAIMRPGGDPLTNLANSIIEADLYDPDEEDIASQVRATLTRSGLGLVEAMRQSDLPEGTNFLLVVDQFEEIFRFRRSDDATDEQAAFFVNLLLEASSQSNLPLYVIITMRSDFLGECSQFPRLADTVNEGEFLIPRLNRDQRKEAILGPVKVAGGGITDRLLLRLLNDIGDDPDQLPILQHALMRTWDLFEEQDGEGDLDLEHYNATGGMTEALSRHADEVYNEQPDEEHKRIAQKLFKSLTEKVDANRGIRRPMSLTELHEICGGEESHLRNVVDSFRRTGCTFLMPAGEREITLKSIIDISHESLMRVWRNLRNWVDEEAQSAKIYRRLADTATLYKEDKAGLYRDPDLQIALSWRKENEPNKTWADRYYPGFEGAMTFLDESHEEAIREEREREEARQREVSQAKALAEAQEKRAVAQARTAKIFKFAGACLFILLCASIYLTKLAVDSKKEVNNKIFQLAARSTATAEELAERGSLFQSMAWFNDAAEYSQENREAQSYVADKLKSQMGKIPVLAKSELLSQSIIDHKYSKEGITTVLESGMGGQRVKNYTINEIKNSKMDLSNTKINSFRAKWMMLSLDGEAISYADINDEVYVEFKEKDEKILLKNLKGFPEGSDFKRNENNKIVIVGQSDSTVLNIYDVGDLQNKIEYQFSKKYNRVKVFYLENGNILMAGNYRILGQDFYDISLIEVKDNITNTIYINKHNGDITSLDISPDNNYIAVGSIESDKGKNINELNIYRTESGSLFDNYKDLNSKIKKINFDSSGIRISLLNENNKINIINIHSKEISVSNTPIENINNIYFSPLGTYLIVKSEDSGAHFLDTVTMEKTLPTINLSSNIRHVFFDSSEEILYVSASEQDSALLCYKFINTKENFIASEMSSEWPFMDLSPMGRPARDWHGPKEFAYDDDESTIVHNSPNDNDPYWIGELQRVSNIGKIKIINRPNSRWKSQMANYLVSILDENKSTLWEKKYLDSNDNFTAQDSITCNIEKDVNGKYIKVQTYDNSPGGFSRKTISFSEIYVQSKGPLDKLNNNQLFSFSRIINPLALNENGNIVEKSILEINNSMYDSSYISNILNREYNVSDKLLSKLDHHYNTDNWSAYMSTYKYLSSFHPETDMGYRNVLYANALLLTKQYQESYNLLKSKFKQLKSNELANLLILNSKYNEVDINNINLKDLIKEHPEIAIFSEKKNKKENLKNAINIINKKLPSYYNSKIEFTDRFYKSFLIEFDISNDSEGTIFYMGGDNYTDGISLKRTARNIELFITNNKKSETKRLAFWEGWLSASDEHQHEWSKHQIFWSANSKTLKYYINGNHASEIRFGTTIGREHPALTIGANHTTGTYGNLKINNFKIYDINITEDNITKNSISEEPIFELSHVNYNANGNAYNVKAAQTSSITDVYDGSTKAGKYYLEFKNDSNKERLKNNYILKSCLEYFIENYQESKKHLIYSINLNNKIVDPLQKQLGNNLKNKLNNSELTTYISQKSKLKLTNWKHDFLLQIIKE